MHDVGHSDLFSYGKNKSLPQFALLTDSKQDFLLYQSRSR